MLEAVQNVVNSIKFDNKLEADIFTNRLYKFVQNDPTEKDSILKIVSKLKWIRNKEIYDYFNSYFSKNYSDDNVLIDFKENAKSSSTRLISFISGENLCNDEQVIKKSSILKEPSIINDNNNIYFIDDYIGSGSTIIENITDLLPYLDNKNIFVVSYAIQEQGYNSIKKFNSNIIIEYKMMLDSYKNAYNPKEIYYINKICKLCPDEKMCFGFNEVGAYVVINKISPNSDISMLWYPGIKFQNKRWINLFDREISYEILTKKNKEMIKKNSIYLMKFYKKIERKYDLTYDEFVFLIYTYGCYYSKDILMDNNYFETYDEMNSFIKKLSNKEYICEKKGSIIIENKLLYNDVKQVVDSIYKVNNNSKKQITTNFN